MVSFGGSKSKNKSSSSSKTNFPTGFFDEAYGYFGDEPDYAPEYKGFGDFDKVESNLYESSKSKLYNAYDQALKIQNEELSNSGLLNSPSKYIESGARDTLNKGYISSLQQAARDASSTRLDAEQKELARETSFNVDTAKTLLANFMNKLLLAAQAGRESKGQSEGGGSGWNVGLLNFGGSQTSNANTDG